MHTYAQVRTPPTHANPLRLARRLAGLTQDQLSQFAQVTRHTVLRAEQGLYIQPPTSIVRALGLPLVATVEEYRDWVRYERNSHANRFSSAITEHLTNGYSFTEFRLHVSKTVAGFAKALVYPISLVERYELTGSNSDSLQTAFNECRIDIRLGDFDECD